MIEFDSFFSAITDTPLESFAAEFRACINQYYDRKLHGNALKWSNQINELPDITPTTVNLQTDTLRIGTESDLSSPGLQQAEVSSIFRDQLLQFRPWRKGPIALFNQHIDTEWRSDWKWDRIVPHISPLRDRTVLDVGCGNGYHCFRMRGEGAQFVLGVDPTRLFLMQFQILKKYLPMEPVYFLPLKGEQLPRPLKLFDTVFSMGVLYHRKSPMDHLEELRDCLISGGELVLESLVIEGDATTILVPEDRYAQMRNVWFIPSALALENLLQRAGFVNIRTVDINQTSLEEQRATEWMIFQSLKDFLDPHDPNKTIEGYPAPRRATLVAERP